MPDDSYSVAQCYLTGIISRAVVTHNDLELREYCLCPECAEAAIDTGSSVKRANNNTQFKAQRTSLPVGLSSLAFCVGHAIQADIVSAGRVRLTVTCTSPWVQESLRTW